MLKGKLCLETVFLTAALRHFRPGLVFSLSLSLRVAAFQLPAPDGQLVQVNDGFWGA